MPSTFLFMNWKRNDCLFHELPQISWYFSPEFHQFELGHPLASARLVEECSSRWSSSSDTQPSSSRTRRPCSSSAWPCLDRLNRLYFFPDFCGLWHRVLTNWPKWQPFFHRCPCIRGLARATSWMSRRYQAWRSWGTTAFVWATLSPVFDYWSKKSSRQLKHCGQILNGCYCLTLEFKPVSL